LKEQVGRPTYQSGDIKSPVRRHNHWEDSVNWGSAYGQCMITAPGGEDSLEALLHSVARLRSSNISCGPIQSTGSSLEMLPSGCGLHGMQSGWADTCRRKVRGSVTCRSLQEAKDGIASHYIRLWLSSRLVPRTSFSPSQVTDRRISHGWTASPSTSGPTYVPYQGPVLGILPAPWLALLCHRHPTVYVHPTRLVVPAWASACSLTLHTGY
jgi:hypothetical protein